MKFTDERILVVAAHPDDEVLGAGGLMATYPGCFVAIASEGTSAQPRGGKSFDQRLAEKRCATAEAAKILQTKIVREGDFADQYFDLTPGFRTWIEEVVREVSPTVIVTHCATDLNRDHRIVSEAVAIAARPFVETGWPVSFLLGFTVDVVHAPGALVQPPTLFVPLDGRAVNRKLQAIACYQDEIRPWPHPRSLEALEYSARVAGSSIGTFAAEPYTLLRGILGR